MVAYRFGVAFLAEFLIYRWGIEVTYTPIYGGFLGHESPTGCPQGVLRAVGSHFDRC
jgi:hypothetical protein